MSTNMLPRICEGRAQVINELARAEDWKSAHWDAMFAADVENIVCECLEIVALIRRHWISLWQDAAANRILNLEATGELVLNALEATERGFSSTANLIQLAKKKGYSIEGSERFADVAGELAKMKITLLDRWPWRDREMIQRSNEEYSRGEFRSPGEILNELQGGGASVD